VAIIGINFLNISSPSGAERLNVTLFTECMPPARAAFQNILERMATILYAAQAVDSGEIRKQTGESGGSSDISPVD
jgi:hypothetical protein